MVVDTSTEFGARVDRRLREERLAWLVTTRPDGTPDPVPIWFLWDGESLLFYSQPGKRKLRNIARNPRVAFHLEAGESGEDIVVISGAARVAEGEPPADRVPEYVAKYEEGIERLGWTPAAMAAAFSVPIRIEIVRLRGW